MVDWAQACTAQMNRPLWLLLQANYGGYLFAVSALLCMSTLRLRAFWRADTTQLQFCGPRG
jgi:hypothetical protein